ncbi:hypothetical protein ACJJTC_009458 [Scirpophaga incertulas]
MTRWRYCVVLAMLLLLPTRTEAGDDEDDDGPEDEEEGDASSDDDIDDTEDQPDKTERSQNRRSQLTVTIAKSITRTTKKRALECYVCTYKTGTILKNCFDPTKNRVHTITCHNPEDKCFTSVISKGGVLESLVRGCRSGCTETSEITCCELNRCNNKAYSIAHPMARVERASSSAKTLQPTVLLFVTVLLLLQTVIKVSFV